MDEDNLFTTLEDEINESPSVCGVIEDDATCTTAPVWHSASKCCGWTDEACDEHRKKLDTALAEWGMECAECGGKIVLIWNSIVRSTNNE